MARVVITGCSTGFGRATAAELARRGHEVIATARRAESLDGLDVARRLALDVDRDDSVAALRAEIGPVDVLVNNAGIDQHGPVESYPQDRARQLFETNFWGSFRMVQAFAPAMREQGSGVIVNLSSVQGVVGTPLGGLYAATKHAVEALSESLHYELGHFGVRVVIVEPGYFATEMPNKHRDDLITGSPYEELDRQWSRTSTTLNPGGRPGPEVVAVAIADAVESGSSPLRLPVGADAELVCSARDQLDDAGFEDLMRKTLDLTW
jgi:NAD(P)-dependent dehydrogenase (short-subunit alcohol dehydrogenase family)